MHEYTFMAELKVVGMAWYAWDKQHTYLYWKCMKGTGTFLKTLDTFTTHD